MERFVKGDIVVLPFPFSDLSGTKRRPALVIKHFSGDDIILCQITASRSDEYSVYITSTDFIEGYLPHDSFIRTNKIFTADSNLILKISGKINLDKRKEVIDKIIGYIKN